MLSLIYKPCMLSGAILNLEHIPLQLYNAQVRIKVLLLKHFLDTLQDGIKQNAIVII